MYLAFIERMAFANPLQSQITAFQSTMHLNSLLRISRTGGLKTARTHKKWRYQDCISTNKKIKTLRIMLFLWGSQTFQFFQTPSYILNQGFIRP